MSELLKNKFMDFEPEPERDVWVSIEKELHPGSQKGFIPVWRKLAVAASLLVIFGLGVFYLNNKSNITPESPMIITENRVPETIPAVAELPQSEEVVSDNDMSPSTQITPVSSAPQSGGAQTHAGTHKKTKTYIVQVTETYQGSESKPVATEVTQQKVSTPIAIVPDIKEPEMNPSSVDEEPETEWIVYEIPVKKKTATEPVASVPKVKNAIKESRNSGSSLNLNNLEFDNVASFAT